MPNGLAISAFASGLGTGLQQASTLEKNKVETDTGRLKLKRMEDEQGVIDKELQVRGAKADYDLTENEFKKSMQAFENDTRRIQSGATRTQAQVAAGAATGDLERQPGELAIKREEMTNNLLNSTLRQTANIYRVAKLGNMDMATQMYNDSGLVEPGHKAKSMKMEEVDAPGPDGTTKKVKVLSIEGEDGKIMRVPAEKLDALDQQFGATYQKVGNDIVRINRDGTTTPVYQATEAGVDTETGDIYAKKGPKAGQVLTPAAAGGINPRPGSKGAARVDEAVTKGRVVIDKYFGISEFSRLDEKSQPAYNSAVARMGALVRGGTEPEKAANQALLEAKDGRLNPDGTAKVAPAPAVPQPGAAPAPGAGYNGPTPWKR
jgi:hypothetical protein